MLDYAGINSVIYLIYCLEVDNSTVIVIEKNFKNTKSYFMLQLIY